ncbi:MAG: PDZ domain-containing protein [Geodermatophilaceae bacterium]|nr:PDZ domain-containing protein [Geodermatophilaceae bacterium]
MTRPYLRFPDLHGDLLAFVAADSVWLATAEGGRAWRLSEDGAPAANPRFSPAGEHLAWTSHRYGHPEVVSAPIGGGRVRRLTYWGNPHTKVVGWTPDGRVLVASPAGQGTLRDHWLRAISLDGEIERLPYGPASALAWGPGGVLVLCSAWAREPAHWKRYRGGTAPQLWLDPGGSGDWLRLLPELTAGLAWPMWVDGRIVFLSDHEGIGNLYSVGPTGGDLQRHTQHSEQQGYVRNPSTDGRRIVYHAMGEVYVLDGLGSDTVAVGGAGPLDVELGSASALDQPWPMPTADGLGTIAPEYDAAASVVEVRGCAYRLTHREGPGIALSAEPGVRIREPALLGRTGNAIWATDADGEDALEIASLEASVQPRRIASGMLGRILHLAPHPTGETVAVISHDGRIRMVETASGAIHEIVEASDGEPEGLAFAPDGSWLAWSQPHGERSAALYLAKLSGARPTGEIVRATSGRFRDFCPAFTADGRYLAFLSTRTFDPVYDVHAFEMTFPSGTRPYLMPLAADDPVPFGPSVSGWGFAKSDEADGAAPKAAADPPEPSPSRVDADGLEERIVAFPVVAGQYEDLRVAGHAVLWLRRTPSGVLGVERAKLSDPAPRPALERFDFAKRSLVVLCMGIDSYEPSADGTRVVVRDKDAVLVLPADREVKDDDPERVSVDLDRLRHEVNRPAEWHQMYDEAARLMRDHYWRADMNGVDWAAVVARYRPLVARLASYDDLVDLLWEVNGELGTSHAYVIPPQAGSTADKSTGLLGADLARDADGTWRVARVLPGESSDPRARSPLRAAGVAVGAGDAIVAVGGRQVPADLGPAALLTGAAERIVELTVRPAGGGALRRVAVLPLADEEPLRYQDWVASRRSYVDEHGNGRLGYLHIPDMMAAGWAQLHRDLEHATRREGLIVDVRYNRGGHTSQLVIERLARRVQAYQLGRHRFPETYPEQAPRGPVVFLANQWSGSDGDIVSSMAQVLNVGPVIGVRTWGGVVGIDHRFTLVDGTAVTQPRYATWIRGPGFSVENHGVDPDIEVPMSPADYAAGRDPQLDAGIAELFRRLAENPASAPPEIPPLPS